jgi:hypothetical protein
MALRAYPGIIVVIELSEAGSMGVGTNELQRRGYLRVSEKNDAPFCSLVVHGMYEEGGRNFFVGAARIKGQTIVL